MDSRKWHLVVVIILIAVVLFALRSCIEVQKPPTFSDFSLSALDGSVVTLSRFKGKMPVLLVFGSTWCPTCKEAIPELKKIHRDFSDRIKLLYIDVQESSEKVSSFVEEYEIPYTVLLDSAGEVAIDYGVSGIPMTVVVDINGDMVFNKHADEVLANIESFLLPRDESDTGT